MISRESLRTSLFQRTHLLLVLAGFAIGCEKKPTSPRFSDASHLLTPQATKPGDFGPLWIDINGDDELDVMFMNHGHTPSLYVNRGAQGFIESAGTTGIKVSDWEYPQQSDRHGGSCGDFDNDGDPDLYIGRGAKRGETLGVKFDELLENEGNLKLLDISRRAGALNRHGRARAGSWMDYDNDGWLDLYVGNYSSNNVMYRNNGDGTFSDVTQAAGLTVKGSRTAWADYDQDGNVDVLLAWPLVLLRNRGDGSFIDVTRDSQIRIGRIIGPYTIAWGDFDNDADMDVFVGSRDLPGGLLVNQRGKFEAFPAAHDWGFTAETTGGGATWGDVDNDGDLDLFVTRSDRILLFENLAGQQFRPLEIRAAGAVAMRYGGDIALGDYDGDGYLDAAIDTLDRHVLLRNEGSGGSWLKLTFTGSRSNRMGFGTKVWVEAEQKDGSALLLYREYTGDSGAFRSMGCGPMHFGLGNARVVNVKVSWLSGREQEMTGVRVNQLLSVVEPD